MAAGREVGAAVGCSTAVGVGVGGTSVGVGLADLHPVRTSMANRRTEVLVIACLLESVWSVCGIDHSSEDSTTERNFLRVSPGIRAAPQLYA
jgi:hypothetical protein